ncbi:MAG: HIT family protein [bacterium]|nr:HIT family protein [bacterium]
MNNDCLFCKMIAGEIPTNKVFEDENVLAFLDIRPVNPGHVLVIPKKHDADLLAMDDETAAAWINGVRKVAAAVKKGMGVEGFNLNVNTGAVAGQVVFHVHAHIMPRNGRDEYHLWRGAPYASDEEAAGIAKRIRDAF